MSPIFTDGEHDYVTVSQILAAARNQLIQLTVARTTDKNDRVIQWAAEVQMARESGEMYFGRDMSQLEYLKNFEVSCEYSFMHNEI